MQASVYVHTVKNITKSQIPLADLSPTVHRVSDSCFFGVEVGFLVVWVDTKDVLYFCDISFAN